MGELAQLPNIGPVVEQQLHQIGIDTKEAFVDLGSEEAWLKIQEQDPSACMNRLFGLEGAIQGIKKKELSEMDRLHLKEFYQNHKLS